MAKKLTNNQFTSIDDATASPYSAALSMRNYSARFYQISMCQYTK